MTSQNKLTRFSRNLLVSGGLVLLLTAAFALYVWSEQRVDRVNELRHRSFLLADELRQSGDDLTRMVRAYVASGDPVYARYFQDILDIRDGKKPRPENYWRPYWELMVGGIAPRQDSAQAIPLLELMRDAGFTEEEFRKLAEAKANSDVLTVTEFEAMKLVRSTGPEAEANRARALRMLFDHKYHQAKLSVMKPIDGFLELVDQRSLAAVQTAYTHATALRWVLVAIGLGLMFMLWRTNTALRDTLGGSLDEVHTQIGRIGSGDFSSAIKLKGGLENSVLGRLSATQAELNDSARKRQRAMEELRRAMDTLDVTRDGVFIFDPETLRFSYVNQGAVQQTGYSREELLTMTPVHIKPLFDEARFRAIIAPLIAGTTAEGVFETVHRRKDGRDVPVEIILQLVRAEGASDCFIAMVRDITGRQRTEDEIRQLNAILEQRVAEMLKANKTLTDFKAALDEHALVAITDARGKITDVNDKFCAISKYAREELIGQDHRIINSGHHPKAFIRELWQTIASGRVWNGELRNRAKDGTIYWVATTIVPFLGDDGKPAQYIAIRADITERKQVEEQIVQLNADLQSRAAQLETANKELESFSYSVSHDLRAPLRHIHGYVEMLTAATEGQLTDKPRRYLQTIAAASVEMGQLIDDLLAFSRTGRVALRLERVSLDGLVPEAIRGLEMATQGRNIDWKIAPLPAVRGDVALLRQVLANLVGNAVKYSRKRAPALIEIGVAGTEAGRAVLFVRDNGAGFDPQYAHKLFGVFQRLHRAEEFEGTGIGLATVSRIVARHGGRVWAEGKVGAGAAFFFTLERAAEGKS